MTAQPNAKRVRIYLNDGDLIGHQAASLAVLEFLLQQGAQGATVFRASEGFGASGRLHSDRFVEGMLLRQPLVIEWVDTPERVDMLLEPLKQHIGPALITVEAIEVASSPAYPVRSLSRHVTAGDVMATSVASVSPSTSARELVELLFGKAYRAVPVVEDRVPVGIITNSDLLARTSLRSRLELLPSLQPQELGEILDELAATRKTARDIMTAAPVTVRTSTSLADVADLLTHRHLKRLPVVDSRGYLAGMLSRLDLLRTVSDGFAHSEADRVELGLCGDGPVSSVMQRDVPTVHPDTPIGEVLQTVASSQHNRCFVVDAQSRVIGLITDTELLERITPSLRPTMLRSLVRRLPFAHPPPDRLPMEEHAMARCARDLMVRDLHTIHADAPLKASIAPMLRGAEKLVAVVGEDGRLVGALDRADVLRGLRGGPR